MPLRLELPLLSVLLCACLGDFSVDDGGVGDAASMDAALSDAAGDAALSDAAREDVRESDAGADVLSPDSALGDTGSDVRGLPEDAGPRDARVPDGNLPDVGVPDAPPLECGERPIPCLPAGTERLVEVNSIEDINEAAPGDVLQVRGYRLGRTRLRPYVTLHGCEGAEITGALTFDGNAGVVEGFLVTGVVVANQTGDYIVRDNEFRTTDVGGGLQANATDGIVGHQVILNAERNRFEGGPLGIAANTRYHNMSRTVHITIRNNVFNNVANPVRLSESGLTGAIDAQVEFNTFVNFELGVDLFGVDSLPTLRANLFAVGETGVRSNVPYSAPFNMGWGFGTETTTMRPISGDVVEIPAAFDAAGNDYRLAAGSLAVDAAGSTSPPDDFRGCIRAAGGGADVGAYESH